MRLHFFNLEMEEAASKNAADGNWIYYESVQENHKSQILRISYHTGAHRYIFASIAANQVWLHNGHPYFVAQYL